MKQKSKVLMFGRILKEEFVLYQRKAIDYGENPIQETGIVGLFVRMHDKIHRALTLTNNGMNIKVADENLKDTLMDIANYANMALVELEVKENENRTRNKK